MQRTECQTAHRPVFAQNGLKTFDDFFNYQDGQTINRNEKRDVTILRFDGPDGPQVYYRKRFFSPHPKDMLFALRSFGTLCSQAELEWRNARILLDAGIETYHPVAWGVQTCCGIERRSFFITEKIDGQSLIAYLFERWDALDAAQRDELVGAMARFFAGLHRARLSLPDSYLWHLFLLEPMEPRSYRFAIIDLHRMHSRAVGFQYAARELGALLFSLPHEWFDDRLRQVFLDAYFQASDDRSSADRTVFLHTLTKREQTLVDRRKKPGLERLKRLA